MQSDEEANAALEAMQDRLGRGPHAALGVSQGATPNEIRTAFLTLTKTFHPARFGRMSAELQKLANEVFLAIRAAHESLRHGQISGGRTPTSPGMPIVKPATSPGMTPIPRPTSVGMPPLQRTPVATAATQRIPREIRDVTKPLPTVPDTRDLGAKTPPLELSRPTSPARKPGEQNGNFPRVDTKPGTGQQPPLPPLSVPGRMDPATTMPPAPSVAVALDLLAAQQWDAARVALSALSAMAPDSRHVRALIAFATGRQAQMERRLDDARVELQRALQLDPDLAAAKSALGELFARRK